MKVVVDTNIVVSSYIVQNGKPARVLNYWKNKAFDLVVSEPLLVEYEEVLKYTRIRKRHLMTDKEIAKLIEDFREFAILIEPSMTLTIISDDPDDNRVLECAEEGGAEYIISGDPDILDLKEYKGIQILSPSTFLLVLKEI